MKFAIHPYSFWNALYSTFRLFLLNTDNVFTASNSNFTKYPLPIEIARWTAAAYTISTVFLAIYRYLGISLRLIMYQRYGNHYIISGYNPAMETLKMILALGYTIQKKLNL